MTGAFSYWEMHEWMVRKYGTSTERANRDLWEDMMNFANLCGCLLESMVQWLVTGAGMYDGKYKKRHTAAVVHG